MRAMILAAGHGKRMQPLTDTVPKPLLPVAGKPLIQYHIERLVAVGVKDIVVNTAWLAQQLEDFLGDGARFGARILLSREGSALETAGGIKLALPLLGDDPFLVVNGDIWTDYPFESLIQGEYSRRLAHLVLVPNPPQHPQGDFALGAQGDIEQQGGPRYTYAGISVLAPALFARVKDGPSALGPLLRGQAPGAVGGELFEGHWYDIGTPERLAQLDIQLRKHH